MDSIIFVLVPGSCHSSLCWQRVVPLLESHGHHVITPELLGIGSDHTPLSQIGLSSWVNQIVDIVDKQPKLVVLVGHSRGGIIISEVAERVPKKIKLLVYLTAFLLPSGETIAANSTKSKDGDTMIYYPDGTIVFSPDKTIPFLYNKTTSEWAERVPNLLSPEPLKIFSTPIKLTDDHYGIVPRAYIECTEDKAIPLTKQRSMQSRLPCKYVITIDADHSPFFSTPSQLVEGLLDIATRE